MSTAHLLTHLQNTDPTIPLPTLLAALSHHLSTDTPTPTTLAAAAISSPFFLVQPEIHDRLQGLLGAFRHAVHLKRDALVKAEKEEWSITRAIFSKGVQWRLRDWVEEVLRGVQGGRAVLRLACCSGLLLGAKAVKGVYVDVERVEDDIVIALAEVMDIYAHRGHASEWEREFQPWGGGVFSCLRRIIVFNHPSFRNSPNIGSYLGVSVNTSFTCNKIESFAFAIPRESTIIHNLFNFSRWQVFRSSRSDVIPRWGPCNGM